MFATLSAQQWVILGAFLVTLVPIAVGVKQYRFLGPELKSLLWFCACSFMLDAVTRLLWIASIPNLFLGHISTVAEFLFIANIYRLALGGFVKPLPFKVLMILFPLLAIANTLFLQHFQFNNSNIKIPECTLIILFALLFFFKLARDMRVNHLEADPMFLVSGAVLIYFSSSLFIFIYSNYVLLYSKELGIRIWFIHALFFILFQLLLSLSLWITPRNSNSPG